MIKVDKVFVAHVKKGSEARAQFMEEQLAKLGIEFEYMLDGDIDDITSEQLNKYFGEGAIANPSTSCAMKHIHIYEEVVKRNYNRVLVLEDDAVLDKNFIELFNKSIDELDSLGIDNTPCLLYYEATHCHFVARSRRAKGKMLYPEVRGLQCLACYVINGHFAEEFFRYNSKNRCDIPIDTYINYMFEKGILTNLLQVHPDICRQGSHSSSAIPSLIGNPISSKRFGVYTHRLRYLTCKYILYNLR